GLVWSIAPIVNCVILASEPVGVHDVSAMELVQMTVSTKISGSETNAMNQGTPKNPCVTHALITLKMGMPTYDTQSGSSMPASGSLGRGPASFRLRRDFNAA